jgi:hypothetical protein
MGKGVIMATYTPQGYNTAYLLGYNSVYLTAAIYTPAAATPTTVTHAALVDAASAGNLLLFVAIIATILITQYTVPRFIAGALEIGME